MLDIFSEPRFQAYTEIFRTFLIRSSPFNWTVYRRSWRANALWNPRSGKNPSSRPQEPPKNIFLIPHEQHFRLFDTYLNMKKIQRPPDITSSIAFARLRPGSYLNCDILNAYRRLIMEIPKEGTLVCSTYLTGVCPSSKRKLVRINQFL